MSEPVGPTVRRRRLGRELRELREAKGLKQEAAAVHIECSTSKLSRMEKGDRRVRLKHFELVGLLDLYGVTDEVQRDKIIEIHRKISQAGWWEQAQYEEVLPSGLDVYVGLEYDARALRSWELGYVPGLMQTEAYARTVFTDVYPGQPDKVEGLIDVRLKRQDRLSSASEPLELWAIIDESVIRRPVGGPDVFRDQLLHMASMSERPNVNLQLLPFNKGFHPGLRGAFTLLEFGPSDPQICYIDGQGGNLFVEQDRQVRAYIRTFDRLQAAALDTQETAALLRRVAEEKP